jgi:hypothetical protein
MGGCSQSRIATVVDHDSAPPPSGARGQDQSTTTTIGERFASAALDDRDLGQIRGGLSVGSGLVVNFAFQEATYVNHSLAQNIVVPTLTVSPGSMAGAGASFSPGSVAAIGNSATQVNSPALAVQSLVNSGMTSIVSNVGGQGVSNVIANTANNQLVQQVITANIGITGLSQTIQQSVAATVLSRVQAASQFR